MSVNRKRAAKHVSPQLPRGASAGSQLDAAMAVVRDQLKVALATGNHAAIAALRRRVPHEMLRAVVLRHAHDLPVPARTLRDAPVTTTARVDKPRHSPQFCDAAYTWARGDRA